MRAAKIIFIAFLWINIFFHEFSFAQEKNLRLASVRILISDIKNEVPAVYLPVFNKDTIPIALTDSLGFVNLNVGEQVFIKSIFYNDTSFIVPEYGPVILKLSYSVVQLDEIKIVSYTAERLMQLSSRIFEERYPKDPYLTHVQAFYYLKSHQRYLEFFQMDGLGLLSGNRKWEAWSFDPGGKSKTYLYMIPIEQRRSFHWDYNGDTIPYRYIDNNNKLHWIVRPFMYRPVFRAFEISGPTFHKNRKFYDFSFDYDQETDVEYVVNFKTKDQFKSKNTKNLFIVGEGKIWVSKTENLITRVKFYFSKYYDINLEINRQERFKKIIGWIDLSFEQLEDEIFPKKVTFECNYLDDSWYSPRPLPRENSLIRYEHVQFGNLTKTMIFNDQSRAVRTFSFVDINSEAEYNSEFWNRNTFVSKSLYGRIYKDLSSKIGLEDQFGMNSQARFDDWNFNAHVLLKLYPQAETFEEARRKHSDLIDQVIEGHIRSLYLELSEE
jgi:hypothetical protein